FHFTVRAGAPVWQISTTLDATVPATVPGAVSATGIESPRLNRNGLGATCSVPKTFPGVAGSDVRFDSYTFTNCSATDRCIVVNLKQTAGPTNGTFVSAYSPSFNPSNLAVNYLADPGLSGTNEFFSFTVPGGASFVVVVNQVDPAASGISYTLSVD